MAAGHATTPAHPSRIAILDALRADRVGPVALRLLRLAHADDVFVRREVMDLLSPAWGTPPWPAAAEAALARLADSDEEVRRRAAWLVVRGGGRAVALTALGELTDPVVRTALAGLLGGSLAHLRTDPLASVRFLAHLDALKEAPVARWAALDGALFADSREAARHLDDVGRRRGEALFALGRERHVYAVVARLLGDPGSREIGADLAREACHGWRAAAVALLPLLVRHGGAESSPALAAALTTASLSEAARRTHGALVAGHSPTPGRVTRRPSPAASPPPYDSATAAAVLRARPVDTGRLRQAPHLFGALLDAGPLTFRQAAQLCNLTFKRPGITQAACAPLWLRHAGPTTLPRLLALMTPHLDDYTMGEYYAQGLARMGRHALPAMPALTAVIDRRTRIPVNDSTRDAETTLDERLLAAAIAARRTILTDAAALPPDATAPVSR
ncbi:hypothetical protein ACFXGT_32265 [Streptomyces sp. NPDC059352]|uniref:hypothetical protein n=1 Tax=Streptomyces sp. NPDC059352 TaxID=3346810 RepID=UPI0036A50A8D